MKIWYVCLLLFFLVISTILLLGSSQTTPSSNNKDREALLDLKSFITSDPSGALSSWGNGSSECTWTGVNCKNGGRVTYRAGSQGPQLGWDYQPSHWQSHSSTFLYLHDNHFASNIPNHLGRLRQLQLLNLSGNLLTGTIPPVFTNCTSLMTIDLSGNAISGGIHASSSETSGPKHGEEPARWQYSPINWQLVTAKPS